MSSILEPNPDPPVTFFDLVRTSFTLCVRLPWVVGTTLLRRWSRWDTAYKPPALREHLSRHVMICLGNHLPHSVWQWYNAADTSGSNLKTSVRYGHIPHIFEPVRTPEFCGYWICRGISQEPIQPRDADIVLFHAHGGGYVALHPSTAAPEHVFLAEILQRHNLTTAIFSLDYTLAPKAAFPKQRDEALAAYDWLRGEMGVDQSKIVVMGDSAGGHLIVSLLVGLYERRHSRSRGLGPPNGDDGDDDDDNDDLRPAGAVLVSPWMNVHTSHPRTLEVHWEERLLKRGLDNCCKKLLPDASPELDLVYGNFALGHETRGSWAEILPARTVVTAGAEELVFLYDIEDFVLQAKKDGADVELDVAEGKDHTWQYVEASHQHSRLLGLPPDEELPEDLMEGHRSMATEILKITRRT
ncbi:alpha/beta hydrolase [Aspergillus lucknowensis]|uniref:Alpha/Beta hydrolase protein n=1 Tax=Aspergillus lucknowensis TaxID=176173 RepID=A0ABR4L8X9_9EURO